MADEIRSGDYVTFVRTGGIPVTVVRYGGHLRARDQLRR